MTIQRVLLTAGLIGSGLVAGCNPPSSNGDTASTDSKAVALDSDAQKFGYSVGVDLGNSLKPVADQVDIAALKQGLDDVLADNELRLDAKTREEVKNTVARKMQEQQMKDRMAKAGEAKAKGKTFLAENAERDEVTVTDSGLQYEVLEEAEGASPTAEDKVTVHYKGTLLDGTEFDSSYSRGEPVTFPLGNVITGWTEGVQLMNVGETYKFYIPSDLAYGESGAPPRIGPNETLIFEVELLGIGDDKAEGDSK